MEQYIYDESNGLWHELNGDYYIPCLKLPDEEKIEIGIWGQRHLEYIKLNRKGLYSKLMVKCEINRYLANINKEAQEMFLKLVKEMAKNEGITEQLKANNQIKWVASMNNIRQRATDIVNNELIYI